MDYLAVAIAGFLGAAGRALLSNIIKTAWQFIFPWDILLINFSGCFVLSFFMNLTLERYRINPKLRLAVGTGFLGAYTTFSTFAVDSVNLIRANDPYLALSYIIATSLGCVIMAWLGSRLSALIIEKQSWGDVEEES